MPSHSDWTILLAGFFAAVMNSIAGGGTMLTFPSLLAAGLPGVLANTTSTVALFLGMPGSVWAFRRRLAEMKSWILPLGLISLLGGLLGGYLLLKLPPSFFDRIVPWLLLFATTLFLANAPIQRYLRRRQSADLPEPTKPSRLTLALQSLVALYGGYFGAGIGIMMLASLSLTGLRDIYRMNALKSLLGMLCNSASVAYFITQGMVSWHHALWLLAGSIPGYLIGSHLSQKIPAIAVRLIVAAIGLTIAAKLFWQQAAA